MLVRFSALLVVAAAAFVFFWSLAFALLPEGLLRGRTGSAALAGGTQAAGSFTVEWLRLFAVNVGVAGVVVVAPNLLRTRRGTPLGYWSVCTLVTVAAIITGTNSFSIQAGTSDKLVPSLHLFAQPGPYELAAYVLAATATSGIGRWQLTGWWPRSTLSSLPPEPVQRRQLVVGVSIAALTLLTTAASEASRIIAAVG